MNTRTVAGLAIAGVTVLAFPLLYLGRRLQRDGFSPAHDRARVGTLDLQVTAISDQTVTLRAAARKTSIGPDAAGRYRLEGARGSGNAGRVIESNGVIAVREYTPGTGEIRAGDYVRLDAYSHAEDPLDSHGMEFETVTFSSPLGQFPAWYVPGSTDTWAILTHGKGADRREALRMLPTLNEAGFHCLVITYRNDREVAPSRSGKYSYGRDEWEELDGAVAYALAHGARDIVLAGFSMGGAITLSFMANSPNSAAVSALILDAPMWHLEKTVSSGARAAGVPERVLVLSNWLSAIRYRFSWADFDYHSTLSDIHVPILLFHGDADRTIPVDLSDAAAAQRPDIITYIRVPGAGHVRAWNIDPEAYRQAVLEFVRTRRRVPTP
jgi:pimeloyl-ACP methyl ester carboxylesterase